MKKISFITSLYKSEEFLPKYIKHVKKMHRVLSDAKIEHEFVILPNDPSDTEYALLSELAKTEENSVASVNTIFKIIPRERETLYTTWNNGFNAATGDIMCSWNVDDMRSPRFIIKLFKEFSDSTKLPADNIYVIYPGFTYVRGVTFLGFKIPLLVRRITPPPFDVKRFTHEMHMGPFFFFTKEAFTKIGPFDTTFRIAGDFEWQARTASLGVPMFQIKESAGIFTNFGTSLSGSKSTRQVDENQRIYDIYKV